jgi:hypothetical protein
MANYSVDAYYEESDSLAGITDKLATKMETIDDGKTMRLHHIYQVGASRWEYAFIVDA